MARRRIGWSVGFWLTVCAGLAAVVAYQLVTSLPLAPTVTAAPPAAPALQLAPPPDAPRLPDEAAIAAIAGRPLFAAGRRPYQAPPPAPDQPAPAPDRPALPLQLAGIFLTDTDRAALLQLSDEPPQWLRAGERIDGWRIERIGQDRVQLRKGDQEQLLLLRADLAGPSRPPARTVGPRLDRAVADDQPLAEEQSGQ